MTGDSMGLDPRRPSRPGPLGAALLVALDAALWGDLRGPLDWLPAFVAALFG